MASERPGRPSMVLWCVPYDQTSRAFFDRARIEVQVAEPDEGLQLIPRQTFDAVVCEWSEGWRHLLPKLEHLTAFVHVGKTLPQSLVDFVLAGGNGWAALTPKQACERLSQALVPRRGSPRVPLDESTMVSLGSLAVTARLLDCSSHGLAFWLPANTPLGPYTAGSVLTQVSLEHRGQLVLREVKLEVRSLIAQAHGFRVGCQFQREYAPEMLGGDRKLKDPLRSIALVARVAKLGAVTLRTEQGERFELKSGQVDATSRRLAFAQRCEIEPFEVVHCSAHLDDARYEWRAAVVQPEPFTLQVPLRIEECVRRHPVRRAPFKSGRLSFIHPLSHLLHEVQVLDFSPTGAQVSLESIDSFPPGLRIAAAKLQIDGAEVVCAAQVRHHDSGRAGFSFEFASAADASRMRLAWVLSGNPVVQDGLALNFDAIWAFCQKAGLVKEEILDTYQSLMSEGRLTQSRLATDDGRLFNALLCRGEEGVIAYISAFRAYEHTWYVQHMTATAPGTRAAVTLNRAIGELCEQTPGAHYFQLAYYIDNPWPARVFGGFARRIGSSGAVLKVRPFHRVRNDSAFVERPSPRCRSATPRDVSQVVEVLSATEPSLLLHAMDFGAERLWLRDLNERYQAKSLERRREVLVCEERGRCVGVAMCEVSSVGINFRELASVSRLFVSPELGEAERETVMLELAAASCRYMKGLGRPFTVICGELTLPGDALWGSSFQLAELTARTELLRDFKQLARLSSAMVAARRKSRF